MWSKRRPLRLASVTVNRSDYGRMQPVYQRLHASDRIELHLVATAAHLDPAFGRSIGEVRDPDRPRVHELPLDDAANVLGACGQLAPRLGDLLNDLAPDVLMLLGDRHEMLIAAFVALQLGIPVAHVGGGYVTRGSLDDAQRHAISKLATWHLVANPQCARIVQQLGEPVERIHVVGAPDVERVCRTPPIPAWLMLPELGLDAESPYLLVTIHPEPSSVFARHLSAVVDVLADRREQLLITAPCPDAGADRVFAAIRRLQAARPDACFVANLGATRYINAMRHTAAVVGNSSSGIIEAAAVPVPVVNIGDRQAGRQLAANVVSAAWDADAVAAALDAATAPGFRARLDNVVCPFGNGHTSDHILAFCLALHEELIPAGTALGAAS